MLQGKRWISRSRKCVQNALISTVLDNDGATCDSLREEALVMSQLLKFLSCESQLPKMNPIIGFTL